MVISMNSAVIIIIESCFILVAESAFVGDNRKENRFTASSAKDIDKFVLRSMLYSFWNRSEIQNQGKSEARQQNTAEPGPIGYIYQLTSGKAIHPLGGSAYPRDGTRLVVHVGTGESRLQLRYIPQPQFGHFGYIQHVSSGKYVHPEGGSPYPGDNTFLVFHHGRHYGTLFTFDEENKQIIHIGGKHWHPYGGSTSPPDNTPVVLHRGLHAATRFYFGDAFGNEISPYPNPDLSGTWQLVKAYINPRAKHTYTETYTVGKVLTQSQTVQHAWSVSAGFAKSLFSASAEYSSFAKKTRDSTWSTSHERTTQIVVEPGKSIVIWQFVYALRQYNEELTFRSNIFGDTDSLNVQPKLSQVRSI